MRSDLHIFESIDGGRSGMANGHRVALVLQRQARRYGRLGSMRLCCTSLVRDVSRESSVAAGLHEQTPNLQDLT